MQLFISHSSSDAALANLIQGEIDRLLLGAVQIFNSSGAGSIGPGEHWLSRIVSTLQGTDVLLALLTPAGLRSAYVHFEAGAVWIQEGALVVPCTAGQVAKGSLPTPYSHLQAVDLTEPGDLRLLIGTLSTKASLKPPELDAAGMAATIAETAQLTTSDPSWVLSDGAALGTYAERSLEIEWRYRRCEANPDHWAATYRCRLDLEVTAPLLRYITLDYSPAVQALSFSEDDPPTITLATSQRSSAGNIRCAPPHQYSGSKFAFRVHFDPPLRRAEVAHLDVTVAFPAYKVGVLEDLLDVQVRTGADIRTYDFNSRIISRLNDHFTYRVVLPLELGATPLDPEVYRHGHEFPEEQAYLLGHPEVFSVRQVDVDDQPAWCLELQRERPPFRAAYRLRWRPPRRGEGPGTVGPSGG